MIILWGAGDITLLSDKFVKIVKSKKQRKILLWILKKINTDINICISDGFSICHWSGGLTINLKNNHYRKLHNSSQEILDAARLTDSVINENEINIDVIQDRIISILEVKKAFVSKDQISELKIEIIEKRPVAILNGENEIKPIWRRLRCIFKNSSKLLWSAGDAVE